MTLICRKNNNALDKAKKLPKVHWFLDFEMRIWSWSASIFFYWPKVAEVISYG